MKLSLGVIAAFVGLASASRQAAQVYTLPAVDAETSPSVSPAIARLILLRRLKPDNQDVSANEIPASPDIDRALSLLNKFGGLSPTPFAEQSDHTRQLIIMLEGMSEAQMLELDRALQMKPAFTISNPPSSKAHDDLINYDFYGAGVTHGQQCTLAAALDNFDARCWAGANAVVRQNVQKVRLKLQHDSALLVAKLIMIQNPAVIRDVINAAKTLSSQAKFGTIETTLILLPASAEKSGSKYWTEGPTELRRRQAELPISFIDSTVDKAQPTSSHKPFTFTASGPTPACFKTKDSCEEATGECSGHGECRNKWAKVDGSDSSEVCFKCHCLGTKKESGGVDHWGGATCQKKDVSVAFWLFAGFTLFMVGILWLSIAMLYSVGEEKLPGVIGAGVSKSK